MTRYLVAAASRETAEAACDYLDGKVSRGDEVYLLTVDEEERPVGDGTAVSQLAQERLADRTTVRTIRSEGRPDLEIVQFARDREVDEIVVGPARGDSPGIGSTTRSVLNKVEVPVFVVPV